MRHRLVRATAAILIVAFATVDSLRRPIEPAPPGRTSKPEVAKPLDARSARLPALLLPNGGELPDDIRFVLRDRRVSARFGDDTITLTRGAYGLTRRFVGGRSRPEADGETGAVVSRFAGKRSSSGLRALRALVYRELWPGVEFRLEPRAGGVEYTFTVAGGAELDAVRFAYEGTSPPTLESDGSLRIETPAGPLRESAPRAFQDVEGSRRELACRFELGADGSIGFAVPERDAALPLLVDPVLDYSTWIGSGNGGPQGTMSDYLSDLKLDSAGHVVVAGRCDSDFPVTAGAFDRTREDFDYDFFVAKLNSSGTALLWATFLGGSEYEGEPRVALDGSDNVVIAGSTGSADFPLTPGAYRSAFPALGTLSLVCKLSADGSTLLWSTFVGEGTPSCVALDASGNVIVAGSTSAAGYPTTAGAFDRTYSAFKDAFVTCVADGGGSLLWSTLLGGNGDDEVRGLALDASGSMTVGGLSSSADFPTTAGAYDTGPGTLGNENGFVTRIAAGGGSLVWSTYLRGSGDDHVKALALDASSNVYLHIYAFSNDFPTTAGSYKPTRGGTDDMVLAKLSADGSTLEWSTFIGAIAETTRSSLAVDAAGNVYAAGLADFSAFPTTAGAWDGAWNADDAFALRLNAGGASLQWSTFIGGQHSEQGAVLALDPSGNVVAAVETGSPELPTSPGAPDRTMNGSLDLYVVKLDTSGQPLWNTYLGGGANDDRANALAVDASGLVYVAGSTTSPDFPTSVGAYDRQSNAVGAVVGFPANKDGFVACFSADLSSLLWCTFLGGTSNDEIHAMALDGLGRPVVAGGTSSSDFPTTPGAYDTTPSNDDAFVARLSSDGQSLLLSTVLGGSHADVARGIAIGGGGEIFVCGRAGNFFPTMGGALDTSFNGLSYDAFIACLSEAGSSLLWSTYLGGGEDDVARVISADAAGVVTVGGETDSADFPATAGAFDATHNFNRDVFVARLSAGGGGLVWSTFLGSTGFDDLKGMNVDASGGVTVSGRSGDPDTWPTSGGAYETRGGAVFVSALSSDGAALTWSTLLGDGAGGPHVIDAPGQAFVGSGMHEGFLTRVLANGADVAWGMGLASGDPVTITGLHRKASGEIVFSGHTERSSFPTTAGAYDRSYNGFSDVVVVRLTPPTVSPAVFDGLGDDQAFVASGSAFPANWSGFEAGATNYSLGLGLYRGTRDFSVFAPMGAGTSGTRTFFLSFSGTRLHAIVRAEYPSGLSLLASSNGAIVDFEGPSPPPAPVAAPSLTQDAFTLTWSAITADPGGSGLAFYEVYVSLNSGPFTELATGLTTTTLPVSGLADGSYRLRVRGVDALGNRGPFSSSSNPVVVDSTPPQTTIVTGPQGAWGSTSAAFTFVSSQTGASFEVRLDGGAWESLGATANKSYASLSAGPHTFEVRSTDPAGNTDASPALRSWTIGAPVLDGTAPLFISFDSPGALSNWTIVASGAAAWAVDDTPSSVPGGPAFSAPFSLNYNNGTDYATGATTAGSAISPPIAIGGLAAPVLRFWCNYQTETAGTSKDARLFTLSSADLATTHLAEQLSTAPGAATLGACAAMGAWHEHTAALNSAWGSVRVRFEFNSVDATQNAFAGWFVDDLGITDARVSVMEQVDAASGSVIPLGGSSSGTAVEFRARVAAGSVGTIRWEVEALPLGTAFTGTPSGAVEGVAGASLALPLSFPGGAFHWRSRTVALTGGATSQWVSFGLNAETDADFRVPAPGGGGGGGSCGATSAEGLLPLALVWMWRRRRPRGGIPRR